MTLYHEDNVAREKIDKILVEIAAIECTLGKDSTEDEKRIASYRQTKLHYEIKSLDAEFYDVIIGNEEQKRTPDVLAWVKKAFSIDDVKKPMDKGFKEWVKKVLHLNKIEN